jgi:hypothetical protein
VVRAFLKINKLFKTPLFIAVGETGLQRLAFRHPVLSSHKIQPVTIKYMLVNAVMEIFAVYSVNVLNGRCTLSARRRIIDRESRWYTQLPLDF